MTEDQDCSQITVLILYAFKNCVNNSVEYLIMIVTEFTTSMKHKTQSCVNMWSHTV